jgi:hypothetical protein
VAAALAGLADDELAALVGTARGTGVGVGGGAGVLDVGGTPVFVKRVPLTGRERARPRSTANLWHLPVRYQYGAGGPGFNAWRELAANELVTAAVLAGRAELFPLLHHWRVLPGRPPVPAEHADVEAVVAGLGGHPAVRDRLLALAAAGHSLVLFSEYLPVAAEDWLVEEPAAKAAGVERDLLAMTDALTELRLLHLDGHVGNLRSDGERLFLTDFGLATSPDFELTPGEQDFAARNATHDAGYAAMRLVNWLVTAVCGVTTPAGAPPVTRNAYVRRLADGDIPDTVPPEVAAILVRHAADASRLNTFYWQVFGGDPAARYPEP